MAQEFQVNSYTLSFQAFPSVGLDARGGAVITWQSLQDGDGEGIYAQRYAAPLSLFDIDGNGRVEPLTDGLLTLRYQFGFRGLTLVDGAIDLVGCTRCNAPAIEGYLADVI